MSKVRLDLFDPARGLERGRPFWIEYLWYMVKMIFFLSAWPWPSRLKVFWLRAFGAKIGKCAVIKPRVNIHLPWKLVLGDHCWLGEEVCILNLETVTLGSHVCISQRAFLCTGNHDYRREDFAYRNAPIQVEDGAWVGAQVFVGPGIKIASEAVIEAGSIVTREISSTGIWGGNPVKLKKERWL